MCLCEDDKWFYLFTVTKSQQNIEFEYKLLLIPFIDFWITITRKGAYFNATPTQFLSFSLLFEKVPLQ